MRFELRNNRDFLAGLLFVACGALALIAARDYPAGTAARMGPGYFPTVLGGLLVLLGAWILARGIRTREKVRGPWGVRPLVLVTLSIVLFGLIVERFGMAPALVALLFVCAAAGRQFRLKEVAILTVVLGVFCAAVFLYALRLPYPLLPGIWWTP